MKELDSCPRSSFVLQCLNAYNYINYEPVSMGYTSPATQILVCLLKPRRHSYIHPFIYPHITTELTVNFCCHCCCWEFVNIFLEALISLVTQFSQQCTSEIEIAQSTRVSGKIKFGGGIRTQTSDVRTGNPLRGRWQI